MADIANLVLAVDSTQVKTGTAALDGLTAAGARAEAATVGLSSGLKGAGAEATAMAAGAQAAARAAMDQAAGFGAAADAARLNTLAMRETLVVARELARGNFTRLPGSLTLLAQGVGSQGGIGAYASAIASQLGLIKQVQNAELAEAAAAAASAAAGVEAAARKAAANIMAADTELALAEAQVRVAEGATAEAAAQVRLAAANEAVAAASAEAAVAQDALAVAMGRANEAGTASAAATRTMIGGAGVGLLGIAAVAGVAYGAIRQFQDQIKDSGALDKYAESLNLTDAQVKKLGGSVTYLKDGTREISDLTVTFGDVMAGVWEQVTANSSGAFGNMKTAAGSAFDGILSFWDKASAALSAGLWTLGDIAKDVFEYIAQKIGQSFYDGVNKAVDALNSLNARIPKWAGGGDPNLIPHLSAGKPIPDLGSLGAKIQSDADANYAAALAANKAAYAGVQAGALQHRRNTLQTLSDHNRPKKPKKPKKANDHGAQEALDKLNAAVAGQWALVAAYQAGDAAAQRAIAMQKAEADAIEHKATAGMFYQAELQKAVAEDVARQAKTNAGLQVETSIRSQLNGELAAGNITVAQYNEKLKLQTTLAKLNVDLENADADHKQQVRDVIKQTIDLETQQLQLESELSALKQIASNDNEIARMQLENSLLGVSNKERATAIAQLEAMQSLQQIDPNGLLSQSQRDKYIQSAVDKAAAGVQTPFQQWAKDIPQTSAAITEALQGIEFKGFDGLASAITEVVTGTKSLKNAFKDVAQSIISDIVQMTIKMLIFRAISSVLGGGFNISGQSLNVDTGAAGAISNLTANMPHLAGGGSMIIGGNGGVDNNVMSINGSPVAKVGAGETLAVYPNRGAANSNTPQQIEVTIVTEPSDDAWAKVSHISVSQIGQAAPSLIAASVKQTFKTLQRPKISGGR